MNKEQIEELYTKMYMPKGNKVVANQQMRIDYGMDTLEEIQTILDTHVNVNPDAQALLPYDVDFYDNSILVKLSQDDIDWLIPQQHMLFHGFTILSWDVCDNTLVVFLRRPDGCIQADNEEFVCGPAMLQSVTDKLHIRLNGYVFSELQEILCQYNASHMLAGFSIILKTHIDYDQATAESV